MRVGLYMRVSTTGKGQTVDNQRRDLRAYCEARGWQDVTEYVDTGISGTKDRRPGLDALKQPSGPARSTSSWSRRLTGSPLIHPTSRRHGR